MVQTFPWLHSTFKDLSNEYSHAQIRVKTKKLWPRQVGEEKEVAVQKLSRPSKLSRPGNLVATPKTVSRQKNCCDLETWSRPKKIVSRPACCVPTKNAGKLKKRPKIDILTYFQAHFTLGPYILVF